MLSVENVYSRIKLMMAGVILGRQEADYSSQLKSFFIISFSAIKGIHCHNNILTYTCINGVILKNENNIKCRSVYLK